jgi:hypothetical protein
MAESGCLKDGHFQNLEVEGITSLSRKDFKPVSTSLTLTKNDCGLIFLNGTSTDDNTLSASSVITLPPAETGLHFKFILNASMTASSGSFTIHGPDDDNASFVGTINTSNGANSTGLNNEGKANIFFNTGSEAGDFVDLTCYKNGDLKRWHTFGNTAGASASNTIVFL